MVTLRCAGRKAATDDPWRELKKFEPILLLFGISLAVL